MTGVSVRDLRDAWAARRRASGDVEAMLEILVKEGVPFETLGAVTGVSGAAIRIKAKRKGWYTPGEPR